MGEYFSVPFVFSTLKGYTKRKVKLGRVGVVGERSPYHKNVFWSHLISALGVISEFVGSTPSRGFSSFFVASYFDFLFTFP